MSDKLDMPSGADYGYVMRYGYVDGKDFTLAFTVVDGPTRAEARFYWVMEAANGDVLFKEERRPIHDPVFGIDEQEWMEWVNTMYPVIDAYIANKK